MKITPAIKKHIQSYRQYRSFTDGFVVLHEGEVSGWTIALNNPQGWVPGCVAVSANFECYRATGGNDYDGATAWTLISPATGDAA
ncbi:MAG: hypothetical protein U5L02_11075 [Rheinheimera sp.]|nr:hypothetical protein [Rheinheimera sp.]